MQDNPCRFLERLRIEHRPPVILTPYQSHHLLDYVKRKKGLSKVKPPHKLLADVTKETYSCSFIRSR